METLNRLYIDLLARGLLLLRAAIWSRDFEQAEAVADFLHNIPTLVNEPNIGRHRYFWFVERRAYLDWASARSAEAVRSQTETYLGPLLLEMEPIMRSLFAASEAGTPPCGQDAAR